MSRFRHKEGPIAFLLGALAGGAWGYLKAGIPGAVFGSLAAGGLALGLVWWSPIGMALLVVLVAFVLLFLIYGAFWSTWLK